MIDGFYSIAFTGHAGSGFGILVFRDGTIVGADAAGATYDGTITPKPDGSRGVSVTMKAPAGVRLVQTGIALSEPAELAIMTILPPNFETLAEVGAQPHQIDTPLGPVNIAFKKIRGF